MSTETREFSCSFGGGIARGRRRLRALLLGLAFLTFVAATLAWTSGRVLAGALAAGLGIVCWLTWRMSGDLEPLQLIVGPRHLDLRLRRQRISLPLAGARGRRLTDEENTHLERLTSVGFFVAASGGFDSHLLGEFDLYGSNTANAVLVEAGEQRVVVTPDDVGGFLSAIS